MRVSTIGSSVDLKELTIIKMEASSEVNIFLKSECLGVMPPRLLQDHSPSGEPHYRALVQTSRGSGEPLVNRSEPLSLLRQATHPPLFLTEQHVTTCGHWLSAAALAGY
jgi:hypothetical protein